MSGNSDTRRPAAMRSSDRSSATRRCAATVSGGSRSTGDRGTRRPAVTSSPSCIADVRRRPTSSSASFTAPTVPTASGPPGSAAVRTSVTVRSAPASRSRAATSTGVVGAAGGRTTPTSSTTAVAAQAAATARRRTVRRQRARLEAPRSSGRCSEGSRGRGMPSTLGRVRRPREGAAAGCGRRGSAKVPVDDELVRDGIHSTAYAVWPAT